MVRMQFKQISVLINRLEAAEEKISEMQNDFKEIIQNVDKRDRDTNT